MPYNVVIYQERVVSLIQRGDGARWIHSKAKAIESTARAIAPKRTGRLAASHVTLPTRGTNRYQKLYRVSAQSYYAAWVHGGTGPWIYPKNGRWLVLPGRNPNPGRTQGAGERTVVRSVRGQRPNPWLLRAARMHT